MKCASVLSCRLLPSMWIKPPSVIIILVLCHRFWWMRYLVNEHIFYSNSIPWGTIRMLFHYYSKCVTTVALVFRWWWSENCNSLYCISNALKSKKNYSKLPEECEFVQKSILRKQFKFQIQSASIVPASFSSMPSSSSNELHTI